MTKNEAKKEAQKTQIESGYACAVVPHPTIADEWIVVFGVSQESADESPGLRYMGAEAWRRVS